MSVRRFPDEFEALLSPAGRRLLKGNHPNARALLAGTTRFVSVQNLIDRRWAEAAPDILERALGAHLSLMEDPIPDWTIAGMKRNYEELLPKTVRVHTALFASRRAKAWERAQDIGLNQLLKSESFHRFAQRLSGIALKKSWGTQVLCYQPGDYSGPHNDHHPEDPAARDGYIDLHLSFCNRDVSQQLLVYEHRGHFSEVDSVATRGGVTCYRLPFWHFTTPLQAKRGRERTARRWVLLGTFLERTR
jgi:hypothetical protein